MTINIYHNQRRQFMIEVESVLCEVSKKKVIGVLPCSGCCNVGMMTTRCVIDMIDVHDNINFVCALGLPLGIPNIINNARKSEYHIALNGCEIECSTKALKSAGIEADTVIVVTKDLKIKKNKELRSQEGQKRT
jgi:uncharacterized metal-binding protein